MRIGIDARFYAEAGGLGRYTRELIDGLEKIDVQNEYLIFVIAKGGELYQPSTARFKKIIVNIRWYSWQEQIWWPLILNKQKIDLMHFLHWNVPLFYRGTFFLTIHDLILLHFPNRRASTLSAPFYWLKYLAHRLVLRLAVRRSVKIFVPSEFVKNDLAAKLGVKPEKITVTYEGVPSLCHPFTSFRAGSERSEGSLNLVKSERDSSGFLPAGRQVPLRMTIGGQSPPRNDALSNPYILYVGAAYPHKNLELMLEAFAMLKNDWTEPLALVLVGRPDYFYDRLKRLAYEKYPWLPIIFLGEVSDAELADLYKNASVFIFPSLSEGFGLPPLEAMAHSAPVLSSNSSCLPEILGTATLYFDPYKPEELSFRIQQVLTDDNLRQKLIVAGLSQVQKYSWQKCAKLTLAEYDY